MTGPGATVGSAAGAAERPATRRAARRERRLAIAAVVIAAVVVGAVVLLHEEQLASAPAGPPGPSVLAPTNASWSLAPGFYEDISFSLRDAATLTGGLYASQGMDVFVFNTTENARYSTSGTTSPHDYASGTVTSLRIYQSLPSGSWYLVIANSSPTLTSQVTVTTSILVTASG